MSAESQIAPQHCALEDLERSPSSVHTIRSVSPVWPVWVALVVAVPSSNLSPAAAAEITVDTQCSLTAAIQAANSDTAVASCVAGNGDDTIVLTSDAVLAQEFEPARGLPEITSPLTIRGNGFEIRRESADAFRLLVVSSALVLDGVTLRGAFIDNAGCGGGLLNLTTANTELIDSTVTANSVANSNDPLVGGFGAGICNFGTLSLRTSAVTNNSTDADSYGVGIYNEGTLSITSSTISGNSTGGGADNGAGLLNFGGTATILHSTFSGHQTSGAGSTIFSLAGVVSIANSIIDGTELGGTVCSGTAEEIVDLGGNLQFPDTSCGDAIPSTDPLLGPLAHNGGPTFSHDLGVGSPAIDAAPAALCEGPVVAALDQRGAARGVDANEAPDLPEAGDCDIGAVEVGGYTMLLRARFEVGDLSEWSSSAGSNGTGRRRE